MNRPAAPLTVVHVASGDLWAGAEVQLYYLVRALKDQGVRAYVVLLNTGVLADKLQEAGIETLILDERMRSSAQIFHALLDLWRRLRPDVVHTHRRKENVLGGISAWLVSIPSIRTVHGAQEIRPPWWHLPKHAFRALDWWSARYFQDRIVVVSDELWDRYRRTFAASKLRTIENGIDIADIERRAHEVVTLPGDLQRVKLAIIGRAVPVKRIDIFLETAGILQRQSPGTFAFYVFGDGPLLDQHRAHARALGLDMHVHFMGFRENIAAYLAQMDMLIMTSDHEGLPITLLEAMCLGVPIVAHAVGGILKLLDRGQCGRLVTEQNPSAYVAAIMQQQQDMNPTLLTTAARHRVAAHYAAASVARLYANIYRELSHRSALRAGA